MTGWLAARGLRRTDARRTDARRTDALIVVVATAGVVAYVVASGGAGFPLDDAWIHQVYARNLAQRGEWAFTPGQPSAGSTSPLWTVMIALGYALGLPYRAWALVLGALCLAATGMLGARVAERLFSGVRRVGVLTGLCIALEWHLVWAAASGMETALFGALSMGVVALALAPVSQEGRGFRGAAWRGATLGLVGAALTATRPEGALLVALAALAAFAARWGRLDAGLRWVGGVAAGWLVGIAPAAWLNLSLSGSVLPNTSAAKQAEYAILLQWPYLQRLLDVTRQLLAGAAAALLPGLVWAAATRVRESGQGFGLRALLPAAWALALLMLYAARLPVTYQHGRYVIPALPPLIVTGVGGTLLLLAAGRRTLWGRVLSRSLALAAAGVLAVFWGVGLRLYATDVAIIETEMVAAARYLAESIPPDALLAVHDIGAVGFFAPRPILDLAGLVSPEVIPIIRDEAALLALMEARGAAYLMTFPGWYPHIVADPRVRLVYQTNGTAPASGGENMAIYRLAWGGE